MTRDEIKAAVIHQLTRIAPEAQGQELASDVNLRDQLDLDSMDALNFFIALHEALGVDIPESDSARLATLDGIVAYLADRLPGPRPGGPPTRS